MKLTRRELAAALAATVTMPPLAAQTEPRDEMQIARDRLKANSDQLAQQQVPMAIEPAFRFTA
jgi:hypothetical protein